MKCSNKFSAVLLIIAMVLSLFTGALADDADDTAPINDDIPMLISADDDMEGKTVILHSNDVHGNIKGYAAMKALKDFYTQRGAEVLVFDAGDYSQGSTNVSLSKGANAIALMNLAGYDAAVIGHHEFDYGYDNLKAIMKDADFAVLAANITENGKTIFGDHTVFTTESGKKIGVFGVDTPETASTAKPAFVKDLSFAGSKELYEVCQAQVDALREENCDYIICLSHLGIDSSSKALGNRSVDMMAKVDGIDLLIDGHSHSTIEEIEAIAAGMPITSAGKAFSSIGVITISDNGIILDSLAVDADTFSVEVDGFTVEPDAEVSAAADAIIADIQEEYGKVFAQSEITLNGKKEPGVRTEETNLGDLITDAIRWFAVKDGNLKIDSDKVIALTNGGSICASIKAGEITKNDINTAIPYGNTVAVVYVKGRTLLNVLEASTYSSPEKLGSFPQSSGVDFTINTTCKYDKGKKYGDSTYYAPASINRVTINNINGDDFEPNATYAIVTNDFCAAGGDTYYEFSVSDVITDTGIPVDEAVMAYITEVLGGVIDAVNYGTPAGRIQVITRPAFTDVADDAWYHDAVNWAVENEVTSGTTSTTFSPNTTLTNAGLVQFMYNAAGKPEFEAAGKEWYSQAQEWAIAEGYITADTSMKANPTRLDVMEMFYAAKGKPEVTIDNPFTDVDSAAATWAYSIKLAQGSTSGEFLPDNTLIRATAVQFLYNISML